MILRHAHDDEIRQPLQRIGPATAHVVGRRGAEAQLQGELAALRAEAPERKADSERKAFADSLRRELKGEPLPAPAAGAEDRAFETIAQELADALANAAVDKLRNPAGDA